MAECDADGAADLDAAHARHHQVGNDQVGRPILEDVQALLGIVGGAHVVALRGERGAQHARDLRFVVDDQNSAGHGFLLSAPQREDYIIRDGAYDFGDARCNEVMEGLSDSRGMIHWIVATALAAATTLRAGVVGRQLDHRGNGVSGAGGVVGHPGGDRALALYCSAVRSFVRLLLSASLPHAAAARRGRSGS